MMKLVYLPKNSDIFFVASNKPSLFNNPNNQDILTMLVFISHEDNMNNSLIYSTIKYRNTYRENHTHKFFSMK